MRINRRGVVGVMVGGAVASGVLALGVALGWESDSVRAERTRIEGAWVAESVRSVSGEITGEAAASYQLEFHDGTVVARGLSGVPESRGRFRVLPGTDPAKIDLRLESGIVFGVYRLEGDTLTAVFNPIDLPEHLGLPERGRPERLEADEKRLLFRYGRRNGSR